MKNTSNAYIFRNKIKFIIINPLVLQDECNSHNARMSVSLNITGWILFQEQHCNYCCRHKKIRATSNLNKHMMLALWYILASIRS